MGATVFVVRSETCRDPPTTCSKIWSVWANSFSRRHHPAYHPCQSAAPSSHNSRLVSQPSLSLALLTESGKDVTATACLATPWSLTTCQKPSTASPSHRSLTCTAVLLTTRKSAIRRSTWSPSSAPMPSCSPEIWSTM
jgi:hypothetical protein